MPMWAKREITANEGLFRLIFASLHPMPSNRPSFASLSRNLRDDVTCSTCRHSFTNFVAKLKNPSPTCFTMKQATGY
jgi:hypothetical protein